MPATHSRSHSAQFNATVENTTVFYREHLSAVDFMSFQRVTSGLKRNPPTSRSARRTQERALRKICRRFDVLLAKQAAERDAEVREARRQFYESAKASLVDAASDPVGAIYTALGATVKATVTAVTNPHVFLPALMLTAPAAAAAVSISGGPGNQAGFSFSGDDGGSFHDATQNEQRWQRIDMGTVPPGVTGSPLVLGPGQNGACQEIGASDLACVRVVPPQVFYGVYDSGTGAVRVPAAVVANVSSPATHTAPLAHAEVGGRAWFAVEGTGGAPAEVVVGDAAGVRKVFPVPQSAGQQNEEFAMEPAAIPGRVNVAFKARGASDCSGGGSSCVKGGVATEAAGFVAGPVTVIDGPADDGQPDILPGGVVAKSGVAPNDAIVSNPVDGDMQPGQPATAATELVPPAVGNGSPKQVQYAGRTLLLYLGNNGGSTTKVMGQYVGDDGSPVAGSDFVAVDTGVDNVLGFDVEASANGQVQVAFTRLNSVGGDGADVEIETVPLASSVQQFDLSIAEGQQGAAATLDVTASGLTPAQVSALPVGITSIDGMTVQDRVSGAAITSTTVGNVQAGDVVFNDNGDEQAPTLTVDVDGQSQVANISFTPVNDSPVLNSAEAELPLDEKETLPGSAVDASDAEAGALTVRAKNAKGIKFFLSDAPVTEFPLSDLKNGKVAALADAEDASATIEVCDAQGACSAGKAMDITVTKPEVSASNAGAIAGATIGALVCVAATAAGFFGWNRHRQQKAYEVDGDMYRQVAGEVRKQLSLGAYANPESNTGIEYIAAVTSVLQEVERESDDDADAGGNYQIDHVGRWASAFAAALRDGDGDYGLSSNCLTGKLDLDAMKRAAGLAADDDDGAGKPLVGAITAQYKAGSSDGLEFVMT